MKTAWMKVLQERKAKWQTSFGLTRLAVFGSQARGDAGDDSDLDLLVNFKRPLQLDLLQFIAMSQELEQELAVPVDLAMESDLKPMVREKILREAVDI